MHAARTHRLIGWGNDVTRFDTSADAPPPERAAPRTPRPNHPAQASHPTDMRTSTTQEGM